MATKKSATKKSARKTASGAAEGNTQLEKLFIDSLKDLYWATTEELKSAIEEHLEQTREQVTRLEEVFEAFGKKAQAKKCDAMEGLIKEGESVVEETEAGSMTRDCGIIMAAQKVEHYEIATYGTLVQLAKVLGNEEAAGILQTTLDEEKQTDEGLTAIANGTSRRRGIIK